MLCTSQTCLLYCQINYIKTIKFVNTISLNVLIAFLKEIYNFYCPIKLYQLAKDPKVKIENIKDFE